MQVVDVYWFDACMHVFHQVALNQFTLSFSCINSVEIRVDATLLFADLLQVAETTCKFKTLCFLFRISTFLR